MRKAHTMTPDEVLAVARAGRKAGCKEALFSLGDKPELRYPEYREWLERRGFGSTIEYLRAMCQLVFEETGLLPHANPGVLSREEMELLRPVNASMGMMLETASARLLAAGRGAPSLSGQGSEDPAGGPGSSGGIAYSVHHGHSDWHRRDARRTSGCAVCDS